VRARLLVAGPIAIVASLLLAASASAAGKAAEVTTNMDAAGLSPPNCSLRDAIAAVHLDADVGGCVITSPGGDDKVTFAPAMSGQTITLDDALGDLQISSPADDLRIIGPGMNQLTIDAHDDGRAFFIDNLNTEISGLSVVNASGEGFPDFVQAGAILNANGGSLTLTDVKVADSTADATGSSGEVFAGGGGIYTSQGRLNLDHSIVTGNSVGATQTGTSAGDSAHARGGGIYALNSFVKIVDSTVSDNTATATSSGLDGADATAGIYTNDELDVTRSTISGGVATATATGAASAANAIGGIAGGQFGVDLQQSTIAANQANATGVASSNIAGGVRTASQSTFISSTIALNGPTSLLTPVAGSNLVVDDGVDATDLENTIISDPRGGGANCAIPSGSITSSGFNDDFSPGGSSCFTITGTDLGANPLLAAGGLADNGGPTQTIALQPTSPMIDQGTNADLTDPSQDQRGASFTRPVDFSGLPNAANGTDIGAFEVQQACPGFTQPTPTTACPSPPPPPPPATTTTPTATKKKCKKAKKGASSAKKKCKKKKK
jgi:hypothetical protein